MGSHDDLSTETAPDPSRRALLKAAGWTVLGAAVASTSAVTVWSLLDGPEATPRAYAFNHAEDVALWIGNGERFVIRVLRGREVLEEHTGVPASRITELESRYFTAHHISVPAAA